MTTFVAKKIGPAQYSLRRDGEHFATLSKAGARWALVAPDKALVVLFNRTKFTADATVRNVLWAIRSMVDFLADRRAADRAEAEAAAYAKELADIAARARREVEEREDRLSFAADALDAQYAV